MRRVAPGVVVLLLSPPALASAQASIAGVVTDASGAMLPGVTVEVSSPALIEKTRPAVTNGAGQYEITSLVSATYLVTFTLPGFNTVRWKGVELTGTFDAKIDAELRVGAVEETVTVRSESPVVDVQNATGQTSDGTRAAKSSTRSPRAGTPTCLRSSSPAWSRTTRSGTLAG